MPQAIPYISITLMQWGASVGTAFAIGTAVVATTQLALINFGLGLISKKLAGGRRNDIPSTNITVRGTTEPRRIVFGKRRCAGTVVFSTLTSSSGPTNDYLWIVVVYAGHQCQAIDDIWIGTEKVTNSQIDGSGNVISGQFAGKLSIWKHLGTSAQTADSNVDSAVTEWTSAHKLQGCTYLVARAKLDDKAWAGGSPENISALISGALCYDPRLDSTNGGSGPQRSGDPSTWAFTQNPALHFRHYLSGGAVTNDVSVPLRKYGLMEPDARITDADIIAKANMCDEALTGGYAPPGNNIRYQHNAEYETTQPRREILEAILQSFAAMSFPEKGRWRLYGGEYETPLHTITDADIYGELRIQDTSSHDERYNAVSGRLVDETAQYIERTTIFQTDSAYETQDAAERLIRELAFDGVTCQYQAQRLQYIELQRSRMQRRVVISGGTNLLRVAKGQNVLLSNTRYGWTNRVFKCVERQFEFQEEAGRVTLTLQRDDPSVYTDLVTAAYTTGQNPPTVFLIDGPATPFSFTATPRVGGIEFAWAIPPTVQPFSVVYELWMYSASTPFSSATKIWEGSGFGVTIPRNDLSTSYFWVRARTLGNQFSGTNPSVTGLAGRAATKWEVGNALNLAAWRIGAITGGVVGEVGNFDVIQSVTGENSIVLAGTSTHPAGPRNRSVPLWMSQSVDASGVTVDGGWINSGDCYGIDHLKTYRSVVVFQYTGTASGNFYHSPNWTSLSYLGGGAVPGEVWFNAFPLSDLEAGKWYASVGFIHGSGYGSTSSGQGGVYDMATGRIVRAGTDYKSTPGALAQAHSAFMAYCANSALRLYMTQPRFEEVNGNEPSMLEVIGIATTGGITPGATETLLVLTDDNIDIGATGSPGSIGVSLASFDVSDYSHPDNETVVTVQGMIDIQSPSSTFFVWLDVNQTGSAFPSPTDGNTVIETSSTSALYAQQSFSVSRHFSGVNSTVGVAAVAYAAPAPSVAKIYGLKIFVEIKKRANA